MLGDAQFWRQRKRAFRKSDKEDYRSLRGHWDSIGDLHFLNGPEHTRHRFEILAEAAARALPNPQGTELWKLWLAELIRRKINYQEFPSAATCSQEFLKNPEYPLCSPREGSAWGGSSRGGRSPRDGHHDDGIRRDRNN